MEKTNKKSNIIKLILVIILVLYFVFLWMDIFKLEVFISSDTIKFLSMIFVFILSFMAGKDTLFSRDIFLLQIGLLITLLADVFLLLLNSHYILGIGLFCLVQIIYSIRYKPKNAKKITANFALVFILLLLTYICIDKFILEIDFLIIIALYYAICLLSSTSKAIQLYKNKSYPSLNGKIIALGMVLFLLCDINVALYNIVGSIPTPSNMIVQLKNISFVSMWLFYLPSQVLLSLSGYSDEYLKRIFSNRLYI